MNALLPHSFSHCGHLGDPWFVAGDVGAALGIKNVRTSLANYPDSEKRAVERPPVEILSGE